VARAPRSLVIHFNRSLFDEHTGELRKNSANVRFSKFLDLGPWFLGNSGATNDSSTEKWSLNAEQPMVAGSGSHSKHRGPLYELRAVVTHYGRHENGHYICYKKHPEESLDEKGRIQEHWWRLSDDDVMKVSEENVLSQGGVFMLFYDCIHPVIRSTYQPDVEDAVFEHAASQPDETEAVPANTSISPETESDLQRAVVTPLPDESEFSGILDQEFDLTAGDESVTTSMSEGDEEEDESLHEKNPQPTEGIRVPPYMQTTNVRTTGKHTGSKGILSSSSHLLMV